MIELKKNKVSIIKKIKKKKQLISFIKNLEFIYRRQSCPKIYDMNASIYIWKRSRLLKSNALFSGNTGIYVMPQNRSIDIDSTLIIFSETNFKK